MNHFTFRLSTLALLAAVAVQPALADDARLYAGGQLGLSQLSTWPAQVNFGSGVAVDGRLGLGKRPEAGAFIGRERGAVRYELEAQFGRQRLRQIELGTQQSAADGSVRYEAVTFNAYRSMPVAERWTAYGALGLGWGRVSLPQAGFGAGGCNCFASASAQALVYQGRIGLETVIDQQHKPFVQLSALRLPSARGQSGSNGPAVSYPRRTALALAVGYRHEF